MSRFLYLLKDGERLPVEKFGLLILTLIVVESSQFIEAFRYIMVDESELMLTGGERSL